MNRQNVLVVSAFGRGNWLATQLQRNGMTTALMDVSERIGTWIPEEAEGPFGFFQSDQIKDSHIERMVEDDAPIQLQTGFNIWLSKGPLEFKGPLAKFRLEKLGVPKELIQYLSSGQGSGQLNHLPFQKKWLALFSHGIASPVYYPPVDSLQTKSFLPLFSTFFVKFASRLGHQKSLDWCRRQGVQVLEKADVVDISLSDRRTLRGVEYRLGHSDRTEVFEFDKIIWCLSSEETAMLGQKLQMILFPRGVLEPLWTWSRYRLKFSSSPVRDLLPLHAVVLQDIAKPWTHENVLFLHKTGSADLFDVWCRLPNEQRFNKDYLVNRGQGILELLSSRLPATSISISEYPVGFDLTYKKIGPARHPVYAQEQLRHWRPGAFNNVYFDSAEHWHMLGWNGMFDHQNQILDEAKIWWNKVLAKRKKQTSSEEKGAEL